jgi:hypothetical protein
VFYKHHRKTHNDKHIYMELKNIKQGKIEWVEVYYERIQKLVHGLQAPTIDNFLSFIFQARLWSYLRIVDTEMKWTTLQLQKEATLLCE